MSSQSNRKYGCFKQYCFDSLEMRLKYNLEVQKVWSMAYQECKQPLVPTQYISGGTGTPPNAMEVMSRIMLMNQYNQGK